MQELIEARVSGDSGMGSVLELGAGAGSFCLHLAEQRGNLAVTGLEASTDLIRVATGETIDRGLTDRVRFDRSDLLSLPISDQSVDLAFGLMVLADAASPHVLLSEAFRVVRPGGSAIFMEDIPEDGESGGRGDALALPLTRGGMDSGRLRVLIGRSPFRGSFTFKRHDCDGGGFLEVRLLRPVPEPPPERGWRFQPGDRFR